jgi:hypothetical protein
MFLSLLRKYFLVAFICLLVNILLFIFWWVITDPGNYIWKAMDETKAHIIITACNKLFFIRYYVSLVIINCLLAALFFVETKRILAGCIVLFVILFYVLSRFLFDPFIGRNYYVIFENQNVSKGFYQEPVLDAGKSICPLLFEKLNDKPSFTREQAARGLGILAYEPACNKLNAILNDSIESIYMRAECYYALKKINTKETRILLEDFSMRQNDEGVDSALEERIDFLEMQDVY